MDVELAFQLAVMAVAYSIGAALSLFAPRLCGVEFAPNHAAFLVLSMPIVSALLAEALTELWRGTPGAFGLGGLSVVLPMCLAGVVAGLATLVAQHFVAPYKFHSLRPSETLTVWLAVAFCGSGVTLALWRFWPEPTARLW